MGHFYAEENRYGLGTTTTIRRAGTEVTVSAGNLFRFASRDARDAWVEAGERREALTAAQARKYHATGALTDAVWEDANAFGHGDLAGFDRFIERKITY